MGQIINTFSKEYEENLRKEVAEEISKLSPEEIYKNYTNLQAECFSGLDYASFDTVTRYNMYAEAAEKAFDDGTLPLHRIIFYQTLESLKLGAFAGLMIRYTNADKEIKQKILNKFINEANTYDDVIETYYKLASEQCDPTDDKFPHYVEEVHSIDRS